MHFQVFHGLRMAFLALVLPLSMAAQTTSVIRPPDPRGPLSGFQRHAPALQRHPKVGLVMSGGGARALTEIGVLRSLEKYKIPIDLIVANSLGSIIGGLYASGYSAAEIESVVVRTNWDEVLPFSEGSQRREVYVGQKQTEPVGYLLIRLEGLQPIIPSSLSGGQRLSNYLMNLTLQALYHPGPSFDDLKIPFRVVTTDLISGQQVILDHGSLAEAMRASVTVPLMYAPIRLDSFALVDGGLVSNIPVDIARALGCDVVIVANATANMRKESQLGAPWEVADQIMTIMMQRANREELALADVVISPRTGDRLVSDFSDPASVIKSGEEAADSSIPAILEAIRRPLAGARDSDTVYHNVEVALSGDALPAELEKEIFADAQGLSLSRSQIEKHLQRISSEGTYRDVYAEVPGGPGPVRIVYHAHYNNAVRSVRFRGNTIVSSETVSSAVSGLLGKALDERDLRRRLELVLKLYRDRQYSLARIDSLSFDSASGEISFAVNEGVIEDIRFRGNNHTKDYVIRRELPLTWGDVFNLEKVNQGLINIASTGLFEYVLLNVVEENNRPVLVFKVEEKSPNQLLLGVHVDNEHNFVGTIDIRNTNFRGVGENLGLALLYGYRDRTVRAEYRANRIFQSYLTFDLKGYFTSNDIFTYGDDSTLSGARWDRVEAGRYRQMKYGGSFAFGSQIERLGMATAELRAEHHQISGISGTGYDPEEYRFVGLKLQTTIDTENKYAFPTDGINLTASYESALKSLGSEVSFSKVGFTYESYTTLLERHTFRPRITVGFADRTLPIAERYSMGGERSFFGLREDDSRGRQIFLVNMEYRYWLPFRIIFDSYLSVRYDLGTISNVPEDLKFSHFQHGIGIQLGLDTPLGAATISLGKGFTFHQKLPESPLATGPLLIYFSIGPTL